MARKTLAFLVFLVMFSTLLVSSTHGRKLLVNEQHNEVPSLEESLYLAALPKGNVPASTPSKKGHFVTNDEKLIARHLAAVDRILRSVPSPGVGH
ncbi:hypothetical protein Pfo_023425 [Paulownia fortunei]|nr:hypothetical protein Pfo_023425 [Paulownia fortunei]